MATHKVLKSCETYGYKELNKDLDEFKYAGAYGANNTAWHGLAALRAGVDLKEFHTRRSPDEFYIEDLHKHLQDPKTQKNWNQISSMNPLGLTCNHPTISATNACMDVPDISPNLQPDERGIVNADGSINVKKAAVDLTFNLPLLSERLGYKEADVRKHLVEYTTQPIPDDVNAYMPPLGGATVYWWGDLRQINDPSTEIAIRVHDQCTGSDVFGTDICTCRPYLMYAVQACVECAQRGGLGIVVYFQKEGRGLGEVTKYRVYNARKAQEGGDRAEKYFYQTESIAGIRDARFQEIMPDILLWLGITRIDWLLSMSSEKYDGIVGAGIKVMQRVSLPDKYVPRNAHIEINAKISAGYHTDQVDSNQVAEDMRALSAIREKCEAVYSIVQKGNGAHFNINEDKIKDVVDYVVDVTKSEYPDIKVPFHSRWRHFDEAEIDKMANKWPCSEREKCRRLLDLVTVSVLLDGGAGPDWRYIDSKGRENRRSEGLAVATLDMFNDGLFSSDPHCIPHRVNSFGLQHMNLKQFTKSFQVTEENNPIVGIKGRFELMKRLGDALQSNPQFFGEEICRPGNIVDYILDQVKDGKVSIKVLWNAVVRGFESIWPETLAGVRRGDVWVYNGLKKIGHPGSDLVPFHKLSQWLTYSMIEPLQNSFNIEFEDMELLTGLAEYRNGGLFVDLGVIEFKSDDLSKDFKHAVGSEVVVEWRALTVVLLDKVAKGVREKLGKTEKELNLSQILQGGTWSAGRQIAAKLREDMSSPILVQSEGTVF